MARKVMIALVLFALVGLAFAVPAANAPETEEAVAAAPGPSGSIGTDEDSAGFAEAAPVGGPVPDGTFQDVPTDDTTSAPPPKKNGASTLETSAVVAGVATVGFSMFYF